MYRLIVKEDGEIGEDMKEALPLLILTVTWAIIRQVVEELTVLTMAAGLVMMLKLMFVPATGMCSRMKNCLS